MTDTPDGYPRIILSGTDPDLPRDIPTGFDKYTDFRPMARGAKAVLQSCWDSIMGRTIALKQLLPQFMHDERERRRFLREARVTAQLQHPNTVPVYEIGETHEGGLYFTMKKIAGEDLFRILQRLSWGDAVAEREYPRTRLLEIITQACNALAYAHVHGVVHRDVKPENIWVGKFGEVILLDFGVAKVWGASDDDASRGDPASTTDADSLENEAQELAMDEPASKQTLTRTGQRPGTPLYMSPEQVLGHRYLDERTDIFSMGVVLYEMLTFSEPFRGKTIRQTFDNIINKAPVPLRERAPDRDIPASLEQIVLKAVSKEPADRFHSMLGLIDSLHEARLELLVRS